MNEHQLPPPPVTEGMRQHALANPGRWIYVIDPDIPDPHGHVPPWAIRGGYPTTPDGHIDEHGYVPNHDYRPGPRTLGLPQPTNHLERALELAATGYGSSQDLLHALASATLRMRALPEKPDHLLISDEDGHPTLFGHTSPERVPAGAAVLHIHVAALFRERTGALLRLNPDTRPGLTLPADEITQYLKQQSTRTDHDGGGSSPAEGSHDEVISKYHVPLSDTAPEEQATRLDVTEVPEGLSATPERPSPEARGWQHPPGGLDDDLKPFLLRDQETAAGAEGNGTSPEIRFRPATTNGSGSTAFPSPH
ncbi:hypothetical protein LX15_004556 [Streptoalloteichus tenebrarius]|uniref:SseB protein N-terminal domain-containing protein n=1 Tax=Streptoalloteichus tenebrarius (strain ATCC 17920 / DSM 40477 / JCM 4838 / CBS 697.72 / NBRC 16177 / NCIMB 11028 / NRRL B-12390 / A12253. 1 / ISP 5477) TaxID=1933 RepID=A0ABT1HZB4_STRSD|nr:type VII secretion system-associated protein [Streptoalloteichus tenebrarius]MCP2260836.1 hypothetical protein [Streptoalloteichus tenebrarius]BFF00490.1 hypothetical protein GCM10020241_21650 [Streptoalloteichus tenebrarius]